MLEQLRIQDEEADNFKHMEEFLSIYTIKWGNNDVECEKWINNLTSNFISFDLEATSYGEPMLLQFASNTSCLLVRCSEYLPTPIMNLLRNTDIVKCGINLP